MSGSCLNWVIFTLLLTPAPSPFPRHFLVLPEFFHVVLHSTDILHDEFFDFFLKKVYAVLFVTDCKFRSSDFALRLKILEALATVYTQEIDGVSLREVLRVSLGYSFLHLCVFGRSRLGAGP